MNIEKNDESGGSLQMAGIQNRNRWYMYRREEDRRGDIGLLGMIDWRGLTLSQVKRQKHSYEDCSDSKIPGFF